MPDITTWVQCLAIYISVVAKKFADRVSFILGYMVDIRAKAPVQVAILGDV